MVWLIIGVILTIIIVGILKDTHARCYEGLRAVEEFDIAVPLWMLVIILILELIPFLNIVLFIAFVIWYIIKSSGKPDRYEDKCIFSLRGETYVGQAIKVVKNFLNIKI
jgi:membrane protein implicated in regulation of membrane protease activity